MIKELTMENTKPSELWEMKTLGEVCKIIGGGTPSKKRDDFYTGDILWATVRDMKSEIIETTEHKITLTAVKNSSTNIIPKGNVIIATRVGLGKTCLLKYDTAINQDLKGIIPNNEKTLSIPFLHRWFTSISEDIIKAGTGATVQGVKLTFINSLKISLPPLDKQRQIVTTLDKAFEAIDTAKANAEKNLKNTAELFESYLQNVFENKGNDWEEKTLGEVCSLYQGLAINAKTKHALVEKSNLPLLRIKDLKNNTEVKFIDPNNYPANALVSEEDIIYTRTGSLGLVFRGRKGVLHNNSFKVVPNDSLSKDFLFIWLQNPIFKSKIMSLAQKAAQPDITHKIFKIQKINIPPLAEQVIIVNKIDALSTETKKLEANYIQKIADLEELKKSVLQKAFSGQLNTIN